MISDRRARLIEKLERGLQKSIEIFHSLDEHQWKRPLFKEANAWSMRELAAHFVYSEENLLRIAQDIASGGQGAPEGLDIDTFNQAEMERFRHMDPEELIARLELARKETIEWVRGLQDSTLERMGRHPVLGEVNVETVIVSIYGHQLLHMREVVPELRRS